jgi:hypothetical protein
LVIALVGLYTVLLGGYLDSSAPTTYIAKGISNGQKVEIVFREGKFQQRGRKVKWKVIEYPFHVPLNEREYMPAFLNGKQWQDFAGMDSISRDIIVKTPILQYLKGMPELSSLDVRVNGHRWKVARRFIYGLLSPTLKEDYINFVADKKGKYLRVWMSGSDAAGSYEAAWIFRSNGKHSVKIDHEC